MAVRLYGTCQPSKNSFLLSNERMSVLLRMQHSSGLMHAPIPQQSRAKLACLVVDQPAPHARPVFPIWQSCSLLVCNGLGGGGGWLGSRNSSSLWAGRNGLFAGGTWAWKLLPLGLSSRALPRQPLLSLRTTAPTAASVWLSRPVEAGLTRSYCISHAERWQLAQQQYV